MTSPASDAGQSRIPTLQIKDPTMKRIIQEAANNKSKEKIFYETFFPLLNPTTPPAPLNAQYPPHDGPLPTSLMNRYTEQSGK
jgi:hypothetical protein